MRLYDVDEDPIVDARKSYANFRCSMAMPAADECKLQRDYLSMMLEMDCDQLPNEQVIMLMTLVDASAERRNRIREQLDIDQNNLALAQKRHPKALQFLESRRELHKNLQKRIVDGQASFTVSLAQEKDANKKELKQR